ncbi:S-layer homology domain-containing protein [Paenibacillus wynnii]|uniref:S-layer homology domain-containing protein n=1 Tax=Paenibacillus wynnii TaxID=268407 RepID=UPI00068D7128|nr:S-layer homology domain-containing protein [Paenibacillus wynnii]
MKRILSSKFFSLGMALLMVISILGTSFAPSEKAYAAEPSKAVTSATVSEATYAVTAAILKKGIQSDWQAMGLVRSGNKLPASYQTALESEVKTNKGTYTNVTDYARRVLASTVIGIDATNFAGYNLVEKIYNNERMINQGINGVIYSLLALDSGHYSVPANAKWTTDKLVSEILSKQNADGGFTLSTGASDPDITAMTLTALSAHLDNPAVKTAGERAIAWLSQKQQSHGGYGDSSESVSQVIIALTSNKIDPTEQRFTKDAHHLIDRLLSFRTADGGFAHTLSGEYNTLATAQAFQALVAYQLYTKGEGGFYNFPQPVKQPLAVSAMVVIEGPQGFIAEGNVQSASALDALKKLTTDKKIVLDLTSSSFGDYVSGIQGTKAGLYGGYDGWNYAVSRGGQWIFPSVGMGDFILQAADRVVVYYGGSETQVVGAVTVAPTKVAAGKSFTVNVQKSSLNWETGKVVNVPANAVQVKVGAITVTTDTYGAAVFPTGTNGGVQTLTVTGYSPGKAPSVARYTQRLLVSPVFADQKSISSWATTSVQNAIEKGIMEGIGGNVLTFAPKENITRAQFAALLLRLTNNLPNGAASESPFSDVKSDAWYYGYVLKAKELGILEGVTATTFKPNGIITRQDMAVMITRAFKLQDSASASTFKDRNSISSYALSSVNVVTESGYMTGFNGAFDPSGAVTREIAAVVAVRLLDIK